jgi:hypothetical protein
LQEERCLYVSKRDGYWFTSRYFGFAASKNANAWLQEEFYSFVSEKYGLIDIYIYIDRDRETERELRLFPKKCLPSSCSNEEAVETQTGGHGKSSGRMKGTEVGVG